jgi:hypothetical protein
MKETSDYIESTLISRDIRQQGGLRILLTRHTFTAGLVFFALFVVLNLAY